MGLTDRLATELSGILNWAIEGWVRLHERGHFLQPKSSEEMITEFEYLGSPISEFIQDRCVTGPEFSVSIDKLYEAWCTWCGSQGNHPGTRATFGSELHAALPGIKRRRHRHGGKPKGHYYGIKLKSVSLRDAIVE